MAGSLRSPVLTFNPLSPNSDQCQISHYNINTYSTSEGIGIEDMIIKVEFS